MSAHNLHALALRMYSRRRIWGERRHVGATARLSTSAHRGTLKIKLRGELNINLTQAIEKACAVKKQRHQIYVLDLSKVTAIGKDAWDWDLYWARKMCKLAINLTQDNRNAANKSKSIAT